MYKIRTYNQISSAGLERFPRDKYEIASEFSAPDAILLRSHKMHNEVLAESVIGVARAGAGFNNIPVADYTGKGVVVFNTPGANANAVKELIIAALLLGSRDIVGGINYVSTLGDMTDDTAMSKLLEAEKKRFAGSELVGKTLGVIGLGAIGALVANMALELGMDVIGFDPAISVEAAWRLSSRVKRMENVQSLLAKVDFVTLHVPAIEATKHLINTESLRNLKPHARILNFAREEIVDAQAVVSAIQAGALGGYITDFPTPALIGQPKVILMPHIGASTAEAEDNCAIMAANQLMDLIENGNIVNSVNFPTTQMERIGGTRITFSNQNVPRILGQVLSILADDNINVIDMVNKSRGDIAYNIIDVEGEVAASVKEKITAIEGVMRVRLL